MKALFCLTAVLVFATNAQACGMFSKSRSGGCSTSRSAQSHCAPPTQFIQQAAVQVPLQVPLRVQMQVIQPPPVTIQVPLQVQVIPQVAVQQLAVQQFAVHPVVQSHSCPPAQRSKIRETFKSREVFKGRASHY